MNHSAPYGIIDPDYARIFTIARCLAWAEGYALAMHGSFTRDLDLIAIPWAPHACEPEHLARRIEDVAGLRISVEPKDDKPHGRLVWTMTLPAFADPRFVDLSIIPPPKSGMISRPDLLRALQKQRDAFVHENFSYDPDTGVHESSVANEEHLEGLDERIKFIASFQAVAETDAAAPGDTGLLVGASSDPAPLLDREAVARADSHLVRLSASEHACYLYPEDTAEHRAMRAAFIDGAALSWASRAESQVGSKT